MRLGFTGTRRGATADQLATLARLLLELKPTEFHQGDCVGADADAVMLIAALKLDPIVVVHPPTDDRFRAFTMNQHPQLRFDVRQPRSYLDRDHDIVDESDRLVACPRTFAQERRSGTWATYRYAIQQMRLMQRPLGAPPLRVDIIWPDGLLGGPHDLG